MCSNFFFPDGWAGNLVHSSHNLDWEFSCISSLCRSDRAPLIRCLEWRQKIGHSVRWSFRSFKKQNQCYSICCDSWRSTKASQGLLQGVSTVAIPFDHSFDFGDIFCSPTYAGCQFSTSLVTSCCSSNFATSKCL